MRMRMMRNCRERRERGVREAVERGGRDLAGSIHLLPPPPLYQF